MILDNYCNDIVKRIVGDKSFGEKLAINTAATAEQLHQIFGKLKIKENLTLDNLLELRERFYTHIPPHVAMKKVIDYLPEELKIKLMPQFTKARLKTEALDLFNTTDSILRSYTNLIAEKTGYTLTSTEFLTIEEIITFLKDGKLPSEEELVERSNGLVIFYEGNKQTFLTGSMYKQFIEFLVGGNKNELKGTVAFRGITKGVARIIFDPRFLKTATW